MIGAMILSLVGKTIVAGYPALQNKTEIDSTGCHVNTEFELGPAHGDWIDTAIDWSNSIGGWKVSTIMQHVCQKRTLLKERFVLNRLWAPFFMMAGISILSGSAGVNVGRWSFVGIDKLAHIAVFGLLGVAWTRSFQVPGMSSWGRWFLAVFLTTFFGLLDEWHQLQNPLRTFEWADLLADFAGSMAGAAAYLHLRWFQVFLEIDFRHVLRLPSLQKNPNSAR
ncbi:MAG TPA: VanZ family protein [Oceanipulchritudo sp.]|nr:VanZ family protein [Oceanipulchritudo sp.]